MSPTKVKENKTRISRITTPTLRNAFGDIIDGRMQRKSHVCQFKTKRQKK